MTATVTARGFHHVAIVVSQLDAAVDWYCNLLGLHLERHFGFADSGVEIAHVASAAGLRIELIRRDDSIAPLDRDDDVFAALRVQGVKHMGVLVDDIDAIARALRDKGIPLVQEPTTVAPAGVRNAWIRDPDGNLIEFNQWLDLAKETTSP